MSLSHPALESRVITGYVAAASALIIVLQAASKSKLGRSIRQRIFKRDVLDDPRDAIVPTGNYVKAHGGWYILVHQIIRFIASDALHALAIITAVRSDWKIWGENAVVIASVRTPVSLFFCI
jgi:hypothetical protein